MDSTSVSPDRSWGWLEFAEYWSQRYWELLEEGASPEVAEMAKIYAVIDAKNMLGPDYGIYCGSTIRLRHH